MKKLVFIISMFLFLSGIIKAQDEQIYKPLILQFEDKKENISYVMESYSYSINKYYTDTISGKKMPVLQLSLSIQAQPDKALIEWLTIPETSKNLKVLCRKVKSGDVYRIFELKNATVVSWSESLSEYTLRDSEKSTLYLELNCKEFSIDNYPLKDFKSPYDDY